jgi:hypothetical protein
MASIQETIPRPTVGSPSVHADQPSHGHWEGGGPPPARLTTTLVHLPVLPARAAARRAVGPGRGISIPVGDPPRSPCSCAFCLTHPGIQRTGCGRSSGAPGFGPERHPAWTHLFRVEFQTPGGVRSFRSARVPVSLKSPLGWSVRFASLFLRLAPETRHGARWSMAGSPRSQGPVRLTNGRSRSSEHPDGLNGRDAMMNLASIEHAATDRVYAVAFRQRCSSVPGRVR